MVSALISRLVILVFGTLYPAYASYKAVKTKNVKEYVKWMMYWIVFAFFTCIETVADLFIAWLPFYYELKILFVLWLLSPATKGSGILYRKVVHPQLSKREKDIDSYISKASDQGYSALLSLGSRGFNYVTNVALTTAIKSHSTITDHLRKSYSMSDLAQDSDYKRGVVPMDEIDLDDETDNRLIEESYRKEMMEKEAPGRIDADKDTDTKVLRKRRTQTLHEPDLKEVDESEEEMLRSAGAGKKTPTYTHKEAYHYGTLPRGRRQRASLRNN